MIMVRRGAGCESFQNSKQSCVLYGGRNGFTLIEMLCVIFLLGVLAGVMALLLKETLEVERLQTEGFDKILQNNVLADQFRADVAQAESAPQEWQRFKSDPRTLILQMPGSGHVVYHRHEQALLRHAVEEGKLSERVLPVGGTQVDVEFVRSAANPKLVCLRLHNMRKGSPLPGQTLEIAAALGGDRR